MAPRGTLASAIVALGVLAVGSAPVAAQTIAITGGKVYPVSGAPIENGTVLIRDGKIVAVGASVAVPADAQRVDATGKVVTPGFINGLTQVGVVEVSAVSDTRDAFARGTNSVAAAFRVVDGLNPRSVMIPPAREGGITTVAVVPAGGLVAGQAALVDLVDGPAERMIVRSPLAMVAQVGDAGQAGTGARGELVGKLRVLLEDARAFRQNRRAYDAGATRQLSASRADLEALVQVLDGSIPMLFFADRASDIRTVLALGTEFGFRPMIAGGAEAWMVADELARARVPVLTGAMNNIPSSFAALGTRQENAALLRAAGVPVVLVGNGAGDPVTFNVSNLRYEAGNAVAYGMSWDDALRAVTATPAEVFGVAERVGTLAAGKDANVVIWSGDPFEFTSRAEHVFVRGVEASGPTRQEELMRRYRTLPPAYGGAPRGP
ncbi:MAG TPA: amidohydrolase family protein [Gemmatimonadaceae bacterium]|nr:amidohydrolase family protein [Gemmatimonadaceae bacterium]